MTVLFSALTPHGHDTGQKQAPVSRNSPVCHTFPVPDFFFWRQLPAPA